MAGAWLLMLATGMLYHRGVIDFTLDFWVSLVVALTIEVITGHASDVLSRRKSA